MSFSLHSSNPAMLSPCSKPYTRRAIHVRAQSFKDGAGGSSNRVDANLGVLKERIVQVKMKERLERCVKCEDKYGWNYAGGYNYEIKRERQLSEVFELFSLVGATMGFTCLTGTVFLCFVSLFIHFNPSF